ncbi:MAG TPA: alcohol dehydrogenase [Salinarimonas sp.]|nr:alcohol dehydrogenase [Salinarimonas sp.]
MDPARMRRFRLDRFQAPLCEVVEPLPEPTGTQVLLKVRACGVCHSDLHFMDGFFDLGEGRRLELAHMAPPRVLGHEIVGDVAALGPGASGVSVGDRRLVYPWIGCGECRMCRAGLDNYCSKPRTLGVRADGGFGTHVLVPHPRYLVDFAELPEHLAATCACSGLTAYSALRKVSLAVSDDSLLLIGAGGVGLAAVHLARLLLRADPIVADIDPGKRAAAEEAGASRTVDPRESGLAERLVAETGGFAAVIDFVGSQDTAELALSVLRRGGRLVSVGLVGGAVSVALPLLAVRTIMLQGSYVGSLDELKELIEILRTRGPYPLPISSRPLAEANGVLDDLRAGRIVGRCVLVP